MHIRIHRPDTALRQRMRTLVFGLVAQRGMPAPLVTHGAADVAGTARHSDGYGSTRHI